MKTKSLYKVVQPTEPTSSVALLKKNYRGFESWSDIRRDVEEMFDSRFNPDVAAIPGEGQGTIEISISIVYIPPKS